jgi:D-alanyl-D-alanine dipeptidase
MVRGFLALTTRQQKRKDHMNPRIDFREQPLPPPLSQVDTDEYQNVEIDQAAAEFNEELVDLAHYGVRGASFYGQRDGLNAPLFNAFRSGLKHVYVRKSVARKLREVNKLLAPYGMAVVVLDGFRPISVQAELWNWMLSRAQALLPQGSASEWEAYALRYASNPTNFLQDDPKSWPTHSTGGAVDLTLEEVVSHKRAYMGGIYLDSSEVSATRHYEELQLDSSSHAEARCNRRLLFWAMTAVGFVNYAFEWWHFDYLTQASVMNQGMPGGLKARYGLANQGQSPA